ncbi:MAG: dTMP kinase [candidate division WOR-3 bacterium]|nr:dTMP kinase [candidate division WOR-3 bacterium]MCX7836858.1 dTMP kinase [candidate division WOR-3 bacterium]MDW8114322.1 dTMP kinase [candidate division WOR-3 bacterium]
MRGVLISFEGIEGCGKTTQAKLLYQYLKERKIPCQLVYEPGSTKIGEKIRKILLDKKNTKMAAKTELFLYLAARAQLLEEIILPSLQEGKVIICDRFSDSTLAYQGGGRNLGLEKVSQINKYATNKLKPHLTILIDIPVALSEERLKKEEKDRLEKEGKEFYEKVRNTFLFLAKRAPKRIKIFNGDKNIEDLHFEIREEVIKFLTKRGVI